MINYLYPLLIGDDELQAERLHTQALGRDQYMEDPDSVRFIVVHCSATRAMMLGHRDLPGVHKSCPCYNVTAELPLVPRSRP